MTRRSWLGLFLLAAMALGGCETAPPQRFPQITYAHRGVLQLDVARVEIVDGYQEPLRRPHVEHLFPTPPEQAMQRWASDRLAATGTPGRHARFVIQDAKVTETQLPRTPGLVGAFTTDQTQRYDLSLNAALEIRDDRGNFREGYATASVARSRTVREDLTINERERIWFEMLEQAMTDLDAELERQIRTNMTRFLAP